LIAKVLAKGGELENGKSKRWWGVVGDRCGAGEERSVGAGILSGAGDRSVEFLSAAQSASEVCRGRRRTKENGIPIHRSARGNALRLSVGGGTGLADRAGAWRRDAPDIAEKLMFFCESRLRIFLYGAPCDMRKSFHGLVALAKNAMGQDPLSGHLFVFVNRRGNQLKALYWDRTGFCIWSKLLSQGSFVSNWQLVRGQEMDYTQLKLFLEGIEKRHQKKRFRLSSRSHME
jgi:transposase